MIIACPNCKTHYKIDPARFKEQLITFRCRKCERTIIFDKDLQKDEKISADKADSVSGIELTEDQLDIRTADDSRPEKAIEPTAPFPETDQQSPPATDHSAPQTSDMPPKNFVSDRRKKILVADDELSICILVEEILASSGYTVITALDGLEAYEKVVSEKPDLVILDLLMPKMTGFEVLKEIRKENKNVPVLVMTAIYKKASQVLVVKELGANGYIEKPFSPDHLLFRVENLLMTAAQQQ